MQQSKKQLRSRSAEIIEIVKAHPGITSAEIAAKLRLDNSTKVSTAIWPAIKRGQILAERISRDGQTMNAQYGAERKRPLERQPSM